MEKALTINISGWVFNINEDAYEKLTEYIKNLKEYFSKQDDGEEIVADIEARIAELFQELIQDKENLIGVIQVNKVIKIMGEPYQIDEESSEKDDSDYEASKDSRKYKRELYRDPLNAHIAGVASGLGKYIGIDPVIIRIMFVLLIATGGLGVILYAILWILIPEASSTSDRIKMEGKRVNIKNIEDKVREEATYIKEKLSDFSEEAKDVYQRSQPIRKKGVQRLESSIKVLGNVFLRILKFLLGLVLLLTGIGFLITYAIFYFNWVPGLQFESFFVNGLSIPGFMSTYILGTKYAVVAVIAISILIVIPIIMLIFNGIRFVFNLKRNKVVGNIAWQAWIVALIVSLGLSYQTIFEFKSDAMQITSHRFDKLHSDTLAVRLNTVGYYQDIVSGEDKKVISQDDNYLLIKDGVFYGIPRLEILATDKTDFELKLYLSANGKNDSNAYQNTQMINYFFIKDSTGVLLDPFFKLQNNATYRYQDVRIKIFVPKGKYISLDRKIRKHFRLRYFWKGKLNACKEEKCCWHVVDEEFVATLRHDTITKIQETQVLIDSSTVERDTINMEH